MRDRGGGFFFSRVAARVACPFLGFERGAGIMRDQKRRDGHIQAGRPLLLGRVTIISTLCIYDPLIEVKLLTGFSSVLAVWIL